MSLSLNSVSPFIVSLSLHSVSLPSVSLPSQCLSLPSVSPYIVCLSLDSVSLHGSMAGPSLDPDRHTPTAQLSPVGRVNVRFRLQAHASPCEASDDYELRDC